MIRVAIYARVSTDQQAQEGDSIPAQLDALNKYVVEHDAMILVGSYVDDGVSGRKIDRDELQRLLDDVKGDKIDQILFTKLDRWFRSVRHYTATQELLDKHSVTWTAIWEPIYDTSTPAGRLIVNQMMSIAQFEAENTSQRIRQVMTYKVAQGEAVTGTVPIGYRIQDKHLVIVPEEADIVRRVFEEYDFTGSINEAARYMRRYRPQITKRTVQYLLRNRKYIGEHRGNLNYCPPIVDKDLFDRIQRKLGMNVSAATKRVHVFTGILKCGICGHRMASAYDDSKGHGYSYYRCPCYYVAPRRCTNKRTIGEKYLEASLVDQLPTIAIKIQTEAREEQERRVDTTKQVAALDRKIARLKELYLAELIGMEEYKKDRADLEKEKSALLAAAEPPKRDLNAINELLAVKDLKGAIEGLTPQEKQVFWRGLIREIRFFPDRSFQVDFV